MSDEIEMREFRAPLGDTGLNVYLRNKRPRGVERVAADRTLLFVHGATFPASVVFDLPIEGVSWMDYIAARGFDVWLMDLPGYGRSDRQPEMDGPADAGGPVTTTDTAIAAVGAAVDFICGRNGIYDLNLMGWSWGTAIMAGYTQANGSRVRKLALFAPLWLVSGTPTIGDPNAKLGVWRAVTREDAKARWLRGVPEGAQADLVPPGVFDAFWAAALASDPAGAAMDPPVLRAPNGVLLDVGRYWTKDRPTWDPAKIDCPVLIVLGEWDADTPVSMAGKIFPKLENAASKRLVVLGRGTHTMALEAERMALFEEVQRFLEE